MCDMMTFYKCVGKKYLRRYYVMKDHSIITLSI